MATLFQFSTFSSSSHHKHFYFTPPFKVYTCPSFRFPTIYASLSKKPRVRKKVRSDQDLCDDIREFMYRFGFPEDHLPSVKELSDHGRQDLAYVVRRRGYKLIKELLATSLKTKTLQNDLAGKDDEAAAVSTNLQDEVEDCAEAVHSSSRSAITNDASDGITIQSEFQLDSKSHTSIESEPSLQEKVANNIKNGELYMIEDSVFDILPKSVAEEGQASSDFEDTVEVESSSGQTNVVNALKRSDVLLSQQVKPSTSKSNTREDCFSTDDDLPSADCNDDSDVESRKKENEVEISGLKFMLHQKELELSELKEQIEKEKLALSLLQSRVETEIRTAQKVVSDKDAELHAAEEALSGLQEVHIQYRGAAESVEVAGSFNGWHQRIKLDPQPSSTPSIVDVMRRYDDLVNLPCIANFVRSFTLWRTVLWLYPGTYEIKFIVDGHWKTDPERESVTKGTIENNILRVNK